MQIIDEPGEGSEETFLSECNPLVLVHVGQHEDKDRQDLGEVMRSCLVIVDARSIPVVLDDVLLQPILFFAEPIQLVSIFLADCRVEFGERIARRDVSDRLPL